MASKPAPSLPASLKPSDEKRLFRRRLLAWYRRHRRDLPWRRTDDPYKIWVSEIMLQQTQVATVIPYFARFVAAFSTVEALAQADEQEVLRHWEGLGYYRRARQMHRAARQLVEQHQGIFPRDVESMRQLPGIGRYTAGAIVSIAFDTPAPILEANTVRLYSRLIAYRGNPASHAGRQQLWQLAESLLPRRNCREFNQALMELGSLVCVPRAPDCPSCPVHELCAAFRSGQQARIPLAQPKVRNEVVREAAVVVWRKDRVLLRRRASGERWAGLWDFLRFPLSAEQDARLKREVTEKVRDHSGLSVTPPRHLATVKHSVTRFRITLDCFVTRCADTRRVKLIAGQWQWVRPAELENIPLSVTGRKLGRLLLKPQTIRNS